MSTIYSFQENAPAQTVAGASDSILIFDATLGQTSKITPAALVAGSGGVVNTTATTLTVTQVLHGNRTVTVSSVAPIAIQLPQATGPGTKYRFNLRVVATATGHTIKVANSTDVISGVYLSLTTTAGTIIAFATTAGSDTMTFNGTTTGGAVGLDVEIQDIKTGFFSVRAFDTCVSTTTTPFSNSV